MMQRRQAALQRLKETQDQPTRFLRLRMTLALIIFLIAAFACIPLVGLLFIFIFAYFSQGILFVQEIILTDGAALEGTFSRGGGYFLVILSGILGTVLAIVIGCWVVVKARLLSGVQIEELNWRIGRRGIFGLFEKEQKNPPRHEFKN